MVEPLRRLFTANQVIVLSVYGQVFFVLGLAIALQSWRHSRLRLARSLSWLAAFGFSHGLHEWGYVFIPLQHTYLAPPLVDLLRACQALLLAISFACLFQFAIELLRPFPARWRWLRFIPAAGLLIWVAWAFGPAFAIASDVRTWQHQVDIWARYGLGFPGAALAAYGLWHEAAAATSDGNLHQVRRALRTAALALAVYSVLGGLVVPTGPHLPGPRFSTTLIEQWLIIPVPVLRAGLGLILAVAIIRGLEVFRIELDHRLGKLEEQHVLLSERERIGRELHDGTLQTVYAAGLLLQVTMRNLGRQGQSDDAARLQQSIGLLDQVVTEIRGSIGALRANPNSRSLNSGLQELAADAQLRALVEVQLALDLPEGRPLPPGRIGHLLAIVGEALSNVARHARATHVILAASLKDTQICLTIQDNGHGMPADTVLGYGLRNMRERARILGGDLSVSSQPGHGTTVQVLVPWNERDEHVTTAAGG